MPLETIVVVLVEIFLLLGGTVTAYALLERYFWSVLDPGIV